MVTPAPMTALGATRAVESIASTGLFLDDHRADFGLGDECARDLSFAAIPPHVPALRLLGHVVFDHVARPDLLAELRLVDGHEIDRLRLADHTGRNAQHARRLRHTLDHQHAGEYRLAREVSLELRLVAGDVLDADRELVAAHLHDAIDHQERIAVRQGRKNFEDAGSVEGGAHSSPPSVSLANTEPPRRAN